MFKTEERRSISGTALKSKLKTAPTHESLIGPPIAVRFFFLLCVFFEGGGDKQGVKGK